MKITVLIDNMAGSNLLAEHGISYLIEHDGQTFLWDTGHSDAFLRNAQKMGVSLHNDINTVVLSHGHWDHGDGLRFLEGKTLITHPDSFISRYRKIDHSSIGLRLTKQEIEARFDLITTADPYYLTNNIIFLGWIPRKNNFEAQTTTFIDQNGNNDFVPDDSALVLKVNDRLIIVSGCAHAGISNTIEYAKEVTGISKIEMVLGGFHLKHNDSQTTQTIACMKRNKIPRVYPSHCTELPALCAFHEEFDSKQIKTGTIFTM